MKYNDVKELLDAGFNADEIRNMLTESIEPNAGSSPEPEPEPSAGSSPEPEPEPEENPGELKIYIDKVNTMLDDMTKILESIQKANVNNSVFPEENPVDIEDIIGKVIAPQNYYGKEK